MSWEGEEAIVVVVLWQQQPWSGRMGWDGGWVGVKRGRRHPRHNLISDLSIDLIERLWPATRQPKRRTTTSKLLAIGFLSLSLSLEWSGRWFHSFHSFAFHSIHLSISFGFSVLYSSLISFSFLFLLFPLVCFCVFCWPCFSIKSIRCWINRPLYIFGPVLANYISAQLSVVMLEQQQ